MKLRHVRLRRLVLQAGYVDLTLHVSTKFPSDAGSLDPKLWGSASLKTELPNSSVAIPFQTLSGTGPKLFNFYGSTETENTVFEASCARCS